MIQRIARALFLVCVVIAVPAAGAEGPPVEEGIKAPPSGTVDVTVALSVLEVDQINDREEKFDIEFYLNLSWKDPRLAFKPGKDGKTKRIVPADQIWTPEAELSVELDVNVQGGRTAHVLADGTVLYHKYYRATIPVDLNLHEFPLDDHSLIVGIESPSYEDDTVRFLPGKLNDADQPPVMPSGWRLVDMSSAVATRTYPLINETYSHFQLKIDVMRDAHYYLWSVVLPLIPIVITSWSVFWMDPKEFSTQIGVGITALLTVVAYKISIDQSLPALSYMTRMDFFLMICQFFVFASFVMLIVIHVCLNLGRADVEEWAVSLTRKCRWIPPILLTATSVLLIFFTPRVMTYFLLGALVLVAFISRPGPGRLRRWIKAIVYPESYRETPAAPERSFSHEVD